MILLDVTGYLSLNIRARDAWCRLPYPDHPKGCPNFGRKASCPPHAPVLWDFVDFDKPLRLVIVEFDLAGHKQKMITKHPSWSERQAGCLLYWQGSVNKRLKIELQNTLSGGMVSTLCPEAMGLDVFSTLRYFGIPIQRNPQETVYKVALVGFKR